MEVIQRPMTLKEGEKKHSIWRFFLMVSKAGTVIFGI